MSGGASRLQDYRWMPHVLSMELRKLFAYRVSFWIRYAVGSITDIAVAYFLWDAIFREAGTTTIEGFSFQGILFYSVFATLVSKLVRPGIEGQISQDVYQGGLTRYLVYPLSFLQYCYMRLLGHQLVGFLQLLFGYFVVRLFWAPPADLSISISSFLLGLGTALLSGVLLFLITACLELVAFWQDTVWNLIAMVRFVANLLGGVMVPIAFFPEWGRTLVSFTPFPLIFSFPIRCFLGQVPLEEWLIASGQLVAWILGMSLLLGWIWRRGTRIYTGVGI